MLTIMFVYTVASRSPFVQFNSINILGVQYIIRGTHTDMFFFSVYIQIPSGKLT